jgi:hypothetical protein
MALIALPLFQTFVQDPETVIVHEKTEEAGAADISIRPHQERLDYQRIKLGVILIGIYCILSVYMMSPPVKKYFQSRPDRGTW